MDSYYVQIIFQLILAIVLGALLGLEREYRRKEAGFRTYSLVTLGTSLFTILGLEFFNLFAGKSGVSFDPSRIIMAIALGIGFIGGGVIILKEHRIEGLTTAAGLWCAAAIGVAIGANFYFLALLTTILAIIILIVFGKIERKFFKKE